jgi:hypothetical protein
MKPKGMTPSKMGNSALMPLRNSERFVDITL